MGSFHTVNKSELCYDRICPQCIHFSVHFGENDDDSSYAEMLCREGIYKTYNEWPNIKVAMVCRFFQEEGADYLPGAVEKLLNPEVQELMFKCSVQFNPYGSLHSNVVDLFNNASREKIVENSQGQ